MNGLGGLNKSPNGVVIGLVQLQLPTTVTRAQVTDGTSCGFDKPERRYGETRKEEAE